jgi:hypothetical protein
MDSSHSLMRWMCSRALARPSRSNRKNLKPSRGARPVPSRSSQRQKYLKRRTRPTTARKSWAFSWRFRLPGLSASANAFFVRPVFRRCRSLGGPATKVQLPIASNSSYHLARITQVASHGSSTGNVQIDFMLPPNPAVGQRSSRRATSPQLANARRTRAARAEDAPGTDPPRETDAASTSSTRRSVRRATRV